MPPEYIRDGAVSKKFDVFSLGVIIIKIMDGINGMYHCSKMPPEQFIQLVRKIVLHIQQTFVNTMCSMYL